jgi:hypothetical protein
MLYLLDASVLITAHAQYYAVDRIPEYWEWLLHMAEQGAVKIPIEIYDEIKAGPTDKDLLFDWLNTEACKRALVLTDAVSPALVQRVIAEGYAPDLTDDEVEQLGRDPFLIAHALAAQDRCVVTVETSSSKKQRANRKIPDVCKTLGAACCDPFAFTRQLGFSTNWKSRHS